MDQPSLPGHTVAAVMDGSSRHNSSRLFDKHSDRKVKAPMVLNQRTERVPAAVVRDSVVPVHAGCTHCDMRIHTLWQQLVWKVIHKV
jgi:hypothetical protein